jgi:branched-chain amino acid transport system permease protein
LIGPVVGTGVIQYLSNWLGTVGVGQVTVVLGAILMIFVLVFPRGLLPTLGAAIAALWSAKDRKGRGK